jgi:hypothetical protein
MSRRLSILLVSMLLAAMAGCEPPNTDDGGSVPEVSGRIEGTVLYVGQRPNCTYADGVPSAVQGNVILLLFRADDPPPPQGTATSAESLLVVPGGELFRIEDCLPETPSPAELTEVITRSAEIVWPDIALGETDAGIDYQIRGFFDRDADFNPFFAVRRLATKGDVAGGAFVSTTEEPSQFARIHFDGRESRPNGQVVAGVAVTLGARVETELPASQIADGTSALSSEATIPATTDPIAREQELWELTRMRLELIDPTRHAGGISIDPHPSGFAFFVAPVDADRDGEQDLHPTLGAAGIRWEHPIVILRRARNPFEIAAGIPDAMIVGAVRPTQTASKRTFAPGIDVIAAPIAVVTLDPTNAACRVPYIPPGNQPAETYESVPVDCQELPTGNYDVNVLAGIAGGRAIDYRAALAAEMPDVPEDELDALVALRTDNGWTIEGGSFSSQGWSIPNELGCPDPLYRPNAVDEDGTPIAVSQVDEDPFTTCGPPEGPCDDSGTNMQCTQGPAGRFSVVDPTPDNAPDPADTSPGHGIAACRTAYSAADMMPREVRYLEVPEACCAPIAHLCGLPLCPLRDGAALAGGSGVRAIRELRVPGEDFTVAEDGTVTPLCVPFLMPASCCAR